jgi:signal transduction histidine kinase
MSKRLPLFFHSISPADLIPQSAEYLGVITQSAQQMAGLLDGVLSYSRLCRRDVNLTTVSLDNAVKAVLQELKLEMEGRPVDLRLDALPGVEGDPWMVPRNRRPTPSQRTEV